MNGYEKTFYERDVPQAVKALKEIAAQLNAIRTIISDPGDEDEHIYDSHKRAYNLPDDYKMD